MDFFGIRQCEVCVSLFYVDRNFVEGTIKRRQQKKPKECSHLYYAEDDAEDDGFFASTGQRSCQTVRLFLIGGRVFGFFLGSGNLAARGRESGGGVRPADFGKEHKININRPIFQISDHCDRILRMRDFHPECNG